MFCETAREIALYDLLTEKYPHKNPQLLQLIAWCGINRPERLTELMEQHENDGQEPLIDLADIDIKAMCPQVKFLISDEATEIELDTE
jgi:hypothetical protein